jgi:hypothetical protein
MSRLGGGRAKRKALRNKNQYLFTLADLEPVRMARHGSEAKRDIDLEVITIDFSRHDLDCAAFVGGNSFQLA